MLSTSVKMLSIRDLSAWLRLLSEASPVPSPPRNLPGSPLASSTMARMWPEQDSGSGRSSRTFDLKKTMHKVTAQSKSLLKSGRGYREEEKGQN